MYQSSPVRRYSSRIHNDSCSRSGEVGTATGLSAALPGPWKATLPPGRTNVGHPTHHSHRVRDEEQYAATDCGVEHALQHHRGNVVDDERHVAQPSGPDPRACALHDQRVAFNAEDLTLGPALHSAPRRSFHLLIDDTNHYHHSSAPFTTPHKP
jgi:hypothetical protein